MSLEEFAASHDVLSRTCLNNLLNRVRAARRQMGVGQSAPQPRRARSPQRFSDKGRGTLAILADLAMVKARHPTVATAIVNALDHNHPGLHFRGARAAKERLSEAHFDAPDWQALADGQRPGTQEFVEDGPGVGSARLRVQ